MNRHGNSFVTQSVIGKHVRVTIGSDGSSESGLRPRLACHNVMNSEFVADAEHYCSSTNEIKIKYHLFNGCHTTSNIGFDANVKL